MKYKNNFKKILGKTGLFLSIVAIFCQLLSTNVALAAVDTSTGTLLPKVSDASIDCKYLVDYFNSGKGFLNGSGTMSLSVSENNLLACAIQTGRISLRMFPYFMQYFANFVLGLVSLIGLLFVVIGGFYYTVAGATDTKEKGKTFIKHALIGMAISFLAWTIVNIVLRAVTG